MELILQALVKRFEKKEVLQGASFRFEAGHIYGLLGRNGAGKTTLFNCLAGDLTPDAGSFALEEGGLARPLEWEELGYVRSTPVVPEFLTAREFLQFFLEVNAARIPTPQSLDAYFELVSIGPADRDKLLKDYSHGMKNKMQMLVQLIADPKVLLLDEPLTSLDVVVAEEMKQLLRARAAGRILILSTHILELALDLCDRIVILHGGKLSGLEKAALDDETFKAQILDALRGDGDA